MIPCSVGPPPFWLNNTIKFIIGICCHRAGSTVKKEKKIFLIYKEIQKGSGAKSSMTKSNGFLISDKIFAHFLIALGSPFSYMTLHPISSEFPYI
jgi:hypothetical protein